MKLYDGLIQRDVSEWHKHLGILIESLRYNTFAQLLCETLGKLVTFQTVVVIVYPKGGKPLLIYNNATHRKNSQALPEYLDSVYILDPFYQLVSQNKATPGSYRLGELTPDSFKQSDYYINHYQQLGLNEEVGIFVDLPDGDYMVISMGRQDGYSSITRTERNVLTSTFPVIRSLVREFWQQHSDSILETDKNQNRLENAFLSFGKGLLTPREQEISSLILQGHSSKSVANELGISAGTVKVHRKNIYTRLNISTQSQLFSRFLTHLESQATSLSLV